MPGLERPSTGGPRDERVRPPGGEAHDAVRRDHRSASGDDPVVKPLEGQTGGARAEVRDLGHLLQHGPAERGALDAVVRRRVEVPENVTEDAVDLEGFLGIVGGQEVVDDPYRTETEFAV